MAFYNTANQFQQKLMQLVVLPCFVLVIVVTASILWFQRQFYEAKKKIGLITYKEVIDLQKVLESSLLSSGWK